MLEFASRKHYQVFLFDRSSLRERPKAEKTHYALRKFPSSIISALEIDCKRLFRPTITNSVIYYSRAGIEVFFNELLIADLREGRPKLESFFTPADS